ncbi:integrase catalytic domain-containing protein [Trichonephila clavipes]|nr:integrase catalytic domain-containing protein [Trichonephila clavipes]
MDKKSKNKNNPNVTTEEKLNRLKDSIKGTLTRLEAFTSEKTVSKDTSVTEIEIKLKKIEQLQINLDKIAEDYCEIEIFESLEIIQLDIEDINQRIETTELKITLGERGIETNSNTTRFEGQREVAVLTYGNKCVLLNTFMIFVKSADGYRLKLRGLLDNASTICVMREEIKTIADAPVKTYKLATVTYGTVSAAFLATRTLKALADEEKAEFPDAADVICNDSYIDDILSGESTLEGAKKLQTRLSQLLQRGGFELHKWVSNSPELLKDLSASSYVFDKEFQDAPVKTLGMLWDPKVDCLTYKVKISDKVNFSKRDVLSEIARLYDPLGLIGPIVTKAKVFIQELWKIKLDWSEQIPPDAMEEWMNFYQKLSKVNNFKIPRCILLPATIRIEIHGFSDASERAFAAVVYIKCFNESGQSQARLLCSKSRVAPLKTLTIPRLELSAALLLSRLVKKVVPILQLPIHKIWMWTDSTIALAWIKTEPHKLKTFVSNRVAEIQALSKDYHWKHVSSKNNPADLISRGCNVDELLKNEMWFSGPDLQTDKYEDNQLFPDPSYRDELKCAVTLSMTECSSNFYDELFNVINNFIKLIRIFSFIFRFINNIKAKESCNKEKYLTADEIKRSTEFLAKIAQLSEFKAEIDALKKGKGVSKTSKLRVLDPFLEDNSLLRVGGRLSNADLPFEAKHQLIIPSKHKFTKLLFEHMHKKFFHIGAQGLVHQIRMQFWPINGKGIARKTVHDCIACFRQKPTGVDQLMGNLPSERVTPKAVTDLTTEAFTAALKRLCARRGRISTLMSDNATNFKGAAAELNRFIKLICIKNETLANYFASEAIQWKFIPPRSPNFGGLWEAGQRNKWQFQKNNVAVGCLVLLKENDLPPCKWAMARILEVIYGTDGKPASSPDLSPIENMWSMVPQRLTQITPPAATPDQLWQRVKAIWSAVPQEHIQRLFEAIPRRVAAVISNNGGYSGC